MSTLGSAILGALRVNAERSLSDGDASLARRVQPVKHYQQRSFALG